MTKAVPVLCFRCLRFRYVTIKPLGRHRKYCNDCQKIVDAEREKALYRYRKAVRLFMVER